MVALYLLCRANSFDFGRVSDVAYTWILGYVRNEFMALPGKAESQLGGVRVFCDMPTKKSKGWLRRAINKKISQTRKIAPRKLKSWAFRLFSLCG